MDYQSKTTIITMSVLNWKEETKCPLSSRFEAMHAVANQISQMCQMDIMSFTPYFFPGEDGNEYHATIVYVNNGRTLDEILAIMKPEIDKRTQRYWMIIELSKWQGLLDCMVTARGYDEKWD